MRLAFLTHEPFYPASGGGSVEAPYLVEEFVRRGHAVHLFCPQVTEPEAVERRFGVRLHPFTRWRMGRYTSCRNFKYVLYPFFLERLVRGAQVTTPFDLFFSQHSIAAVACGRLKRRLRRPAVMNLLDHLTGFLETWPPYLMPKPVLRHLEAFESSLPTRFDADGVLTVSDTLADYVAATGYPRDRVRPIYFGYDAALFPLRPLAAAPSRPPTVVMHGSLDHHHLGPIALEALATVQAARPEVTFKFVGRRTAVLERFLSRVRARIPAVRIECTDFVPYDQVAGHLAAADVGMVPYEASLGVHCAFVAKVVEYLGVGLPTVCTPLRSLQRYFGNEPLLRFAEFDGASFGRAILGWLGESPEARGRLAPAASERVRRELDWRVISRCAVDFTEETARRCCARK